MSTIDTSNIDPTKPTSGSATTQSVRDNFSQIKTALDSAKTDIGLIESGAASISAIRGIDITNLADGYMIHVLGHTNAGDGGGGLFRLAKGASAGTYTDDNGITIVPTGGDGSSAWIRQYDSIINAEWFGLVYGDNSRASENTSAIQAAINAAETEVLIPLKKSKLYVTKDIQLKSAIVVRGTGQWSGEALFSNPTTGIIGNGTGPVFKTGTYPSGDPNAVRSIELRDLRVENTNYPCIEILTSPTWRLVRCLMRTTEAECVKVRYSVRGTIDGGWYNSSYTIYSDNNFTITAYDNVNGLIITPDTVISGGSNGGGVDISQSQHIKCGGIFEVCGGFGIRAGGYSGTGAGNVGGIDITGYFEQVDKPISAGESNVVSGLNIEGIFLNNGALSSASYCVKLGRVYGWKIKNNSFYKQGSEPTLVIVQPTTGGGITDKPVSGEWNDNYEDSGPSITIDSSVSTANQADIYAYNILRFGTSAPSGVVKEYISPVINANTGIGINAFAGAANGGRLVSVEILEATGTLNSTLDIGYSGNISENVSVDVSTLTYSNGMAVVPLSTDFMRPSQKQLFRVVAGTGTGSYRIRILYRN